MVDSKRDIPRAVLIAGPTASGKSSLALAVAVAFGGEIINADALQLYRDLRVLTARPTAAEEAACPHHLYGVLASDRSMSAADWAGLAGAAIDAARARGRLPIVVGGSGLYFRALTAGLAAIPDIDPGIRAGVRRLQAEGGAAALARCLAVEDAAMMARLRPSDTQRLGRALEVVRSTGRSLADWQADAHFPPVLPLADAVAFALLPERGWLNARIGRRFDEMVAAGALDEARALADLPADAPVMRALGLRQLIAHLRGEMTLPAAVADAKTASRRYAKRQATWIRHQMIAWHRVSTQENVQNAAYFFAILRGLGLTATAASSTRAEDMRGAKCSGS